MILNVPRALSGLSSAARRPLGELIAGGSTTLSDLLEPTENPPGKALELHRSLMALQVAMTDDALKTLTLNDLASPARG